MTTTTKHLPIAASYETASVFTACGREFINLLTLDDCNSGCSRWF